MGGKHNRAPSAQRERNLHACDRFVINIDTKWTTHAPLAAAAADGGGAADDDRASWRGAPWTCGDRAPARDIAIRRLPAVARS